MFRVFLDAVVEGRLRVGQGGREDPKHSKGVETRAPDLRGAGSLRGAPAGCETGTEGRPETG